MGSRRKTSLDPRWFLNCVLLAAAALVLPALSLDSLLCHFCPLQQKGKPCPNLTSQCLPDQRCSSSRGHYGAVHILSAQGCVDAELCGSHQILSYRGVEYNVSHACCCKDECNVPQKSKTNLKKLLGIIIDKIKDKIDHTNITTVLREEPWDSCANYTSLRSSKSSSTAS